nr:MAG TPA: hypothetical protein [Caudoviricetes sp.]
MHSGRTYSTLIDTRQCLKYPFRVGMPTYAHRGPSVLLACPLRAEPRADVACLNNKSWTLD